MSDLKLKLRADWQFRGDTNVVDGRMVPFDEPAMVFEDGEVFWEVFDAGSLTRMVQIATTRGNAGWIAFNLDHDDSFDYRIGYARSIDQRDDGAWGSFKLYPSQDLAKIRAMLEESHTGLSVEFNDIAPPREIDGVRHRVSVAVKSVAATPLPTYEGAKITAMRATETSSVLVGTPALDEWDTWLVSRQP